MSHGPEQTPVAYAMAHAMYVVQQGGEALKYVFVGLAALLNSPVQSFPVIPWAGQELTWHIFPFLSFQPIPAPGAKEKQLFTFLPELPESGCS